MSLRSAAVALNDLSQLLHLSFLLSPKTSALINESLMHFGQLTYVVISSSSSFSGTLGLKVFFPPLPPLPFLPLDCIKRDKAHLPLVRWEAPARNPKPEGGTKHSEARRDRDCRYPVGCIGASDTAWVMPIVTPPANSVTTQGSSAVTMPLLVDTLHKLCLPPITLEGSALLRVSSCCPDGSDFILCHLLPSPPRVSDGREIKGRIPTSNLEQHCLAAGVALEPLSDVEDLVVDDDPARILAVVLGYLLFRVVHPTSWV
mmetsp:Transcript_12947/g.31704  ORF Transcript_12947/g.31704 Transcript_12947/m.31704 type:complete len:259 (+) Transcript_12947:819-1595(+)